MGSLVRGFRFVIGLCMIAGGATLIVPFARIAAEAATAAGRHGLPTPAAPATVSAAPLGQEPGGMAGAMAGGPPAAGWMISADALPPPVELRDDYAAPPPPSRLPAVPASLGAEGPAMNGNYRSTLAVPPPPLLDAQAPPPAAGPGPGHASPVAAPPQLQWHAATAEPPATYVIRDGDDLTGIATRFYGHPSAAAAVWDANRDLIPDPGLLPIGVALRMPPPWTVSGLPTAASAGRAIEPPRGMVAPVPEAPRAAETPGWLTNSPPVAPAVPAPRVSGGTVRLAPGETLESLALRFYGDRSAANRIWEANRDRLRSPELAVTGMELRLP